MEMRFKRERENWGREKQQATMKRRRRKGFVLF
jgi:hypothetical protein